jgi:hypothetical protein
MHRSSLPASISEINKASVYVYLHARGASWYARTLCRCRELQHELMIVADIGGRLPVPLPRSAATRERQSAEHKLSGE